MTASQQPSHHASTLAGRNVLVTRAAHQTAALAAEIVQRGGKVAFQPAIEIVGPESWTMIDSLIRNLAEYGRLVFVSSNAVKFFFERLIRGQQLKTLQQLAPEVVAIGKGTQSVIEAYGVCVSRVPKNSNSQSLAEVLVENPTPSNTAIFRADRGSAVLSDRLAEAKVDFEEIVMYRSQDVLQPDPAVATAMAEGQIDWTTITSSAIANSVANLFGAALGRSKIATISPTTTSAVERLGFSVAAEARRYDLDGMIAAIEQHEADRQ